MNPEVRASSEHPEWQPATDEAPSQRARALRDEILGSALTLDEAAYILSLDRTTVAKYLREKTLFGFQIGREWLIPEEQLRAYVRRMAESTARENVEAKRRGILDRMRPGLFGGEKPAKR